MIVLVTHGHPTMLKFRHPNLGRLIQPRHYSSIEKTSEEGIDWAADNDCFQGLDERAFVAMLERISGLPGCLFVTCPDFVGDHAATLERFHEWGPKIRGRELPVAFVLQDGCTTPMVPWEGIDAVFVGGTDDYKLGLDVPPIIAEAKSRGLWAHMGRVNSAKRTRYAASIGIDSIDGTRNSRWANRYIPVSVREVTEYGGGVHRPQLD